MPFLRHRAGDYQHFNLITGIDDNENTSRLPILKCTPITVTQNVHYLEYAPTFYLVIIAWGYLPGRRLSTFYWTLSVYSRPLQPSGSDTQCIQQTGYSRVGWTLSVYSRPVRAEWVGPSVYTADRLQPSGLATQCIQQTGYSREGWPLSVYSRPVRAEWVVK